MRIYTFYRLITTPSKYKKYKAYQIVRSDGKEILVHSIDKLNQRDTFLNLPDPSCYFIRVIDSCNAIGKKSISHFFINLTVNSNEEFVNTLDWTHYMGWDGIDHYNIYRRITDQSSHS